MSHIVNKNLMKKLFLLSVMLLLVTRIWAQNITGTVVNEKLSQRIVASCRFLVRFRRKDRCARSISHIENRWCKVPQNLVCGLSN